MTQQLDVDGLVKERLPSMKASRNQGVVHSGLRKRPEFEQIVNYLNYGQETVRYPDREAKFIRNHPYMTQLDFFDMQEDQQRAWEQQMREHAAEELAKQSKTSKAMVRATETMDAETQDRLVSNEEIDAKAANATSVYEHELEIFTHANSKKRDSNANTMDFRLARQRVNPSWDYPDYDGPSPSAPPPPDDDFEEEEEASGSASAGARRKRLRTKTTAVGPDGESLPLRFLKGIGNIAKRGAAEVYDRTVDPTGARAAKAAEEAAARETREECSRAMRESANAWADQQALRQQEAWRRINAQYSIGQGKEYSIATPREDMDVESKSINWSDVAEVVASRATSLASRVVPYPFGLNAPFYD
jgi:hypothetical protein